MAIVRSHISANPWESMELPSCCTTRDVFWEDRKLNLSEEPFSPQWNEIRSTATVRFFKQGWKSNILVIQKERVFSSPTAAEVDNGTLAGRDSPWGKHSKSIIIYLVSRRGTLPAQSDSMLLAESLLFLAKSHFKDYRRPSFRLVRFNMMTHA